jgi:hypothetical protein
VLGQYLKEAGIGAYVGEATGYVLKFSNGLVAYLSGDTGITGDQDKVVRGHYNAKLAVMNIGDTFTTGPTEAAYVINDLVKPNAVIASHANEVGTVGGKVRPGSRTETFIKASKVPVHVPLSGKTMEFSMPRIHRQVRRQPCKDAAEAHRSPHAIQLRSHRHRRAESLQRHQPRRDLLH